MQLDPLDAYALDVQGFLVVEQAFDRDLVQSLAAALQDIEGLPVAEQRARCRLSWSPVVNEMRVLDLLETDPRFLQVIDHPAILARVRATVPGPQRLVEAFSITRGRGVGLPLHAVETARYRAENGTPRCDMLTAVVCLTDTGPDDGPFVVFAGTHKLGVPWPFSPLHPAWKAPAHDVAVSEAARAAVPPGTRNIAWEDIPGYRELTVRAGDLILFAQSLWHGAKELRSDRVRRTLYFSYSPYHFCNWHGLSWSDALRARATPAQRELLAGPFIGQRYPSIPATDLPAQFAVLEDSELGPRRIDVGRSAAPAASNDEPVHRLLDERLHAIVDARHRAEAGTSTVTGDCVLATGAGAPTWTVTVAGDGAMRVRAGGGERADTVVEIAAEDLAGMLRGTLDPVAMWNGGRLRVRGNIALAMQVASRLCG